ADAAGRRPAPLRSPRRKGDRLEDPGARPGGGGASVRVGRRRHQRRRPGLDRPRAPRSRARVPRRVRRRPDGGRGRGDRRLVGCPARGNLWPYRAVEEGMSQEQRVTTDDDAGPGVRVEVSRDRDAEFTAFVRDSAAYLHRTAYLLCGDGHRAEELVQSTFERVYRTWAKVRPGTQRAYARQILVN